MANVGDQRDEVLSVDKTLFRAELQRLMNCYDQLDASIFFKLIHRAYDKAINDIHQKIKDKSNIYIIPNRKKAIRKALSMSTKDTVIVFAGKGNEDNIIYNDKVISHNDINYLTKSLK